mmetsp:Transcript_25654/g.59859  ORF Transcript_25654/g.59859 Transcript_25654/m.59859 type:complete len:234 (+) Transcript_25654:626-1327(+)
MHLARVAQDAARRDGEAALLVALAARAARAVGAHALGHVEGGVQVEAAHRHPDAARRLQAPLGLARLVQVHRFHLPALVGARRRRARGAHRPFRQERARPGQEADGDDLLVDASAARRCARRRRQDAHRVEARLRAAVRGQTAERHGAGGRGGEGGGAQGAGVAARGRARGLWGALPRDGRLHRPRRLGLYGGGAAHEAARGGDGHPAHGPALLGVGVLRQGRRPEADAHRRL